MVTATGQDQPLQAALHANQPAPPKKVALGLTFWDGEGCWGLQVPPPLPLSPPLQRWGRLPLPLPPAQGMQPV